MNVKVKTNILRLIDTNSVEIIEKEGYVVHGLITQLNIYSNVWALHIVEHTS